MASTRITYSNCNALSHCVPERWAFVQMEHGLLWSAAELTMSTVVRLLGFLTLPCGCVVGRYRERATSREVSYVEEKGVSCQCQQHRRNHTISAARASRTVDLTDLFFGR